MAAILDAIVVALVNLITVPSLAFLILGTLIGMTFGAIPGLGGTIALVLVTPATFSLRADRAITLLAAMLGGVAFGGSISAILVNTPGTAPNAATCLDGYPMARQDRAGEALAISATSSAMGAIFGLVVLTLLIPVSRELVLAFGPPEFFWLAITGLTMIATVGRGSLYKSLIAGGLGMILGFIGFSGQFGEFRYGFGLEYFWGGIGVIPPLIGLFAIAEVINLMREGGSIADGEVPDTNGVLEGVKTVFRHPVTFLRSSAIGTAVGMIPGAGGAVANFISYSVAAQSSNDPDSFGRGNPKGLIAAEAANDSKDGGALIPTVVFGIPGSVSMVVLLGAFMLHGLTPGRQMLSEDLPILFTIILSLLFANLLTSLIGLSLSNKLAKVTQMDIMQLVPVLLLLSFTGAFAINMNFGDITMALIFGVVGYAMMVLDYSRLALILGLILGPLAENNLHLSLRISETGPMILFTRPFSIVLILVIVASILLPIIRSRRDGGESMLNRRDSEMADVNPPMTDDEPPTTDTTASDGNKGRPTADGLFTLARPFFERLFILVLIAFVGYILVVTMGYNERAQLVPLTIAIPTVLLLVGLLARQVYNARIRDDGGAHERSRGATTAATEHSAVPMGNREIFAANRRLVQAVLWVSLLFALVIAIGILYGGLIFLVGFYAVQTDLSWPRIALYTGSVTLFLWFVFQSTLKVPIAEGMLFTLL